VKISTAFEIFGNPLDLSFSVKQLDSGESYGVVITRGPGHRFKPLLSGKTQGRENALAGVRDVLDTSIKYGTEQLPSLGGNPNECLTAQQKDEIMAGLEKSGEYNTFK
jgi:hypothetical protein